MKLKSLLIAIGFAAMCVPAMAQYEGTAWYDRIGTGEDSLRTRQNLSLFQTAINSNNWIEAYESWKPVFEKAPFSQMGIYTNGAYMLAMLIQSEQDKAKKQQYFQELMNVYDTRVKNLAGLNSFTKPERRATEGDVIARKAYDYAAYGPSCDPTYTLNKAYDMFSDGIKKIAEQGGREVEGFVLDAFFRVSYAKYQADNNGFREQFLQDYLESKEVCDKMLQLAKEEPDPEKAQKIVAKYDQPLGTIEGLFAESKAADREQIIAIFTPKVEANKDNLNYLKSALTVMAANDCDDTPIYYKAAEYAYNIEPTYESAIGTAQKYQKDGKVQESKKYYDDAIELCKSDVLKGNICLRVAAAMRKAGDNQNAFAYLDKAVQYNSDLSGKCYMQRANIATKAKQYAEAKKYCDLAAEADITLAGQAQRLKQSIQTVEAHNAEYARQKAEYDRQQAEIKAEEDFWKAGKK
ncbi:MAG: tetratricopeptide repeat protein [Bacteroidaceae bacterium]|nr:tetratricopeptide repeat protein [Bacteroidaceae bacterium]